MISFRNDFWGHVGWCSAEGVNGLRGLRFQAEPKVYQFELLMTIQENVFGFDISMDNILIMEVFYCLCDCFEELFGFGLLEAVFGFGEKIIIEGISTSVLKN
jgi:hypothetical protein